MAGNVILASNRLPVNVTEHEGALTVQRSIGGVATALDAVFQKYRTTWVGWMGLGRRLHDAELADLDLPERLVPVQLETELAYKYYNNFANQVVWPAMHHFWPTRAPSSGDWKAVLEVSRRFAAAIKRIARPQDTIWVHDFHLMMVPKALRDAGLSNRIGFFLHTPFATPHHMWAIAHHKEIMDSLNEVDVLGVQTRREVEQMWECIRALGECRQPGLIRSFPIGIDYAAHATHHKRPMVQQLAADIRRQYLDRQIIFSVSRLDYTKGILTQLDAVERFLEAHPHREQFVYKLIVAPSRESVKAYVELQRRVREKVETINIRLGAPGWQPVHYTYENYGLEQMAAWYIAADVLLLTPIIDGMNLIAKEYIAVRRDPGVLVLSNGAGAAAQLCNALIVPPEDPEAAAQALRRAVAITGAERRERWARLQRVVRDEDVFWWAERFITTLQKE